MDVPSCLVRTETFPLGIWEEADSVGRTSLAEGKTQHRFGKMPYVWPRVLTSFSPL